MLELDFRAVKFIYVQVYVPAQIKSNAPLLTLTHSFQYFSMSTQISLFRGGNFYYNLNNFDEYLIQHSFKLGGTNDHFRWVKEPGPLSKLKRPVDPMIIYHYTHHPLHSTTDF